MQRLLRTPSVRRMLAGGLLASAVVIGPSAAGATAATVAAAPDRLTASTESTAHKLTTKYLDLIKDKDLPGLKEFLSPAFQLQRADGTFANKAEYLKNPAALESYEIQNVRATRAGDVIVVRYDLVVQSTINGQQQSNDPAPRLSVFEKGSKGWQIVAHANFNVPAEAPTQ